MLDELVEGKEGKDLLVRAKTGTGKTLAFLVPGIERRVRFLEKEAEGVVRREGRGGGRRVGMDTVGVFVISPTRELATQIAASALNLSVHHAERGGRGFGVQLLVGGESRTRQMKGWVEGRKDVVVGTPGRLRDLLEGWQWREEGLKEVFGRSGECVVVLDEGDTLMDMGFRSEVEAIMGYLKKGEGRQTWMFSATVGKGVEGVAREVMRRGKWEYVDCVGKGEERDVHGHVRQVNTVVDGGGMGSFEHLLRLMVHDQLSALKSGMRSKMMVFLSTTKMTRVFARLVSAVAARGGVFPVKRVRVYEMHSGKDMRDRVRISKEFREREVGEDEAVIMVSSDVSARGVDYPNVSRVVQIGVPGSREGYVHRVGRTGRGDAKEGRGDLVLAPWEMGFLKVLGDVGMEPCTVEGVKNEIEALAGELGKKVGRIEDVAKSVATQAVGEGEYRAAWASMAGFYVGNGDGVGLGAIREVVEGSGRWVEQLGGLEKGSLGIGPDCGLPRGVMDRLVKDKERGKQRGRERAWGSYGQSQRRGGWSEGGRERRGGWSEDRVRERRSEGENRQPSWMGRGKRRNY